MGRITMQANGEEAEKPSYPLIEDATLLMGLKSAEDGVTATENAYNNTLFILEVLDEGASKGLTMPLSVTWIPKGRKGHGFCLQFLKAIGVPFDGELDFDTDDFVAEGRTFRARIGREPAKEKGKFRNIVAEYIYPNQEGQESAAPASSSQGSTEKKAAPAKKEKAPF